MQVDDVVAQLVVFGLDGFVVFMEEVVVADLLFEFLDVAFFALAEGPLVVSSQMLVSWALSWFEGFVRCFLFLFWSDNSEKIALRIMFCVVAENENRNGI